MKYIGIDLGGTKLSVALIGKNGNIIEEKTQSSQVDQGWNHVKNQILKVTKQYLSKHADISGVGIASAGPLDSAAGILLDPTNFKNKKTSWGKVFIVKELKNDLQLPVFLENDAAAAVLAEHWIGWGKNIQNVVMLTLGTGLGVGILCNDQLVRGGRNLHPEAGHLIIHPDDKLLKCGCGNYGCAEAFVSGKNFEARARLQLKNKNITVNEIINAAKRGNKQCLNLFDDYAQDLAITLHNYIVMFYPELVILSGGFSHVAPLFLPNTKKYLKNLLSRRLRTINLMPQIKISKLQDSIGTIGGAYLVKKNLF